MAVKRSAFRTRNEVPQDHQSQSDLPTRAIRNSKEIANGWRQPSGYKKTRWIRFNPLEKSRASNATISPPERLHQLAGKLESEALRAARGKASVKTIVGETIVNVILQGSCEDSGTVQVFHKIRLKDISRDRIHGLRQQTTGISPSAFKGSLITQHENHAGSRFNRFVPNGFDTKTFRILF